MSITLISEQIVVDKIRTEPGREPDEEIVRQLVHSIPLVGVLQPIVLHRPASGMGIDLVFGLNRLSALRRLKIRATLARVINGKSDEIKAWIEQAIRDENLIRRICLPGTDPNVVSLIKRKRAIAS